MTENEERGRVLTIRLTGPEAELGRVAAADVARLLLGVERAVARAAGHLLGDQLKAKGRRGSVIERTTRFRLRAVQAGSVIGVLELPDLTSVSEEEFELDDKTLGQSALERALDVAAGTRTDDIDVAGAWADVLDEIGVGSRIESLTLDHRTSTTRRAVTLDTSAHARLAQTATQSKVDRPDTVVGVLVEADFEKFSARLRSSGNEPIIVTFDPELADAIQEALRQQAEFEGDVTYDPKTARAQSVRLRQVTRAHELTLGLAEAGGFWEQPSVGDLIHDQGVRPIDDVGILVDSSASKDEVDAFLAALSIEA